MKVLISVDIHRGGRALVEAAVKWLAARTDVETIDLVYVFELAPAGGAGPGEPYIWHELMPQWESLYAKARSELDALLERVPEERRGNALAPLGTANSAVAEMTHRYDLVMVGTQQHKGLSRFWLGSHAERLVRSSAAPVMVLPLSGAE